MPTRLQQFIIPESQYQPFATKSFSDYADAHPPQAPISEPPSIEEPPEPDPEFEQRLADIRAFSDYADANPPRFESAQTQPGTQWGDTSSPAAPDQQEVSNSADMMVPPALPPSDSPVDSALGDVKAFQAYTEANPIEPMGPTGPPRDTIRAGPKVRQRAPLEHLRDVIANVGPETSGGPIPALLGEIGRVITEPLGTPRQFVEEIATVNKLPLPVSPEIPGTDIDVADVAQATGEMLLPGGLPGKAEKALPKVGNLAGEIKRLLGEKAVAENTLEMIKRAGGEGTRPFARRTEEVTRLDEEIKDLLQIQNSEEAASARGRIPEQRPEQREARLAREAGEFDEAPTPGREPLDTDWEVPRNEIEAQEIERAQRAAEMRQKRGAAEELYGTPRQDLGPSEPAPLGTAERLAPRGPAVERLGPEGYTPEYVASQAESLPQVSRGPAVEETAVPPIPTEYRAGRVVRYSPEEPPPSIEPPKPPNGGEEPPLSPVDDVIVAANKVPEPRRLPTVQDAINEIETQISDKMAAINRVGDQQLEAMVATYPGRFDAGVQRATQDTRPIYDAVGNDPTYLNTFILLRRYIEAANAKMNPERLSPGGIKSVEDAEQKLAALEQQVGPDVWGRIQEADALRAAVNHTLLWEKVRTGFIPADLATKLEAEQPHYNPVVVLKYLEERNATPVVGNRLDQNWNTIKRLTDEGSKENQLPPMQALERAIMEGDSNIRRNDILNRLAEVSGFPSIRVPKTPVGDPRKTRSLTGFVSYFKPETVDEAGNVVVGGQHLLQVPPDVERALKAMDAPQLNVFLRAISATNAPLRVGATRLNPAFITTNAAADFAQAFMREGVLPPEIFTGYVSALRKDPLYQRYIAAGGGFGQEGSYFRSGTGFPVGGDAQAQARALKKLEEEITRTGGLVVKSPTDLMRVIGKIGLVPEAVEMGPRLAVFAKHLGAGESDVVAAMAGRRATVDFARSGAFIRQANAAIPFLNARVQGTLNDMRTLRDNPAARFRLAGLMGLAVGAYEYNRNDPAYADIPDYVKQSNLVLMLPGSVKDPSGLGYSKTNYIAFPIRGWASATIPVDAFLRAVDKQDVSVGDTIANMLASSNPIPGEASLAGSVLGSTFLQLKNNRDFYRGSDIVPRTQGNLPTRQQVGPQTTKAAIEIADKLGGRSVHISPRQIDFAVQGLTGGAGRTAMQAASTIAGQPSESLPVLGGLTRSVVRNYGGGIRDRFYDDAAQRRFDAINNPPSPATNLRPLTVPVPVVRPRAAPIAPRPRAAPIAPRPRAAVAPRPRQ